MLLVPLQRRVFEVAAIEGGQLQGLDQAFRGQYPFFALRFCRKPKCHKKKEEEAPTRWGSVAIAQAPGNGDAKYKSQKTNLRLAKTSQPEMPQVSPNQ